MKNIEEKSITNLENMEDELFGEMEKQENYQKST
jgi:hypothetical protein